jgi:formate/nitrite transporter FocA (FNT family)
MRTVLIFTISYTVLLFAYGQMVDSPLTNLYTGINVGLFILFAAMHKWAQWPVHAVWAMSLIGLGNMIGGVLLVGGVPLYTADLIGNLRYDKIYHALAAGAFTIVAWDAMKRWAGDGYHRGGLLLFTWLVVMGGGAVVEIAELIGSTLSEVSVGDYGNNALDLVANALGATVGIGIILWMERGTQKTILH